VVERDVMMIRMVAALVGAMAVMAAPAAAQVAGGWTLGLPTDAPGQTCGAAKLGVEVNTRLLRNRGGKMVLIAARGDWDHSEPVTAGLSVDGAEAVEVEALTVGPLVLVLVADAVLEARVKAARTLDWTLPWGAFHAEVEGLGAAYDKVEVCQGAG
jgi:hypothetical protein